MPKTRFLHSSTKVFFHSQATVVAQHVSDGHFSSSYQFSIGRLASGVHRNIYHVIGYVLEDYFFLGGTHLFLFIHLDLELTKHMSDSHASYSQWFMITNGISMIFL